MADVNIDNMIDSLMKGMGGFFSTKTVVGEPRKIDDTIIIPLVDVTFGMGTGAGSNNAKASGGGGIGGRMTPSAVLIISNGVTKLVNIKKYTSLFTDIEGLLPGILPKVVEDEKGDKRYRKYTESLASETKKWFICDECLPEMNKWTSNEFKYQVEDDRRKRIQGLVRFIYTGLKACDEIR